MLLGREDTLPARDDDDLVGFSMDKTKLRTNLQATLLKN
jgi:hypothetical protein